MQVFFHPIYPKKLIIIQNCCIITTYQLKETMLLTTKPKNYLNNKDILAEIHKSKTTYCYFATKDDHQYDFIIDYEDNNDLHRSLEYASRPETIQRAKEGRAYRLSQITTTAPDGTKIKAEKVDPLTIETKDLIFRIMTWDHIPVAPKQPRKNNKPKSAKEIFQFELIDESLFEDLEDKTLAKEMGLDDLVHVRLNFPPFQHFRIDDANSFYCVGKSHWKGDLVNGEFSKEHGQITNKLATMYLKLCEKYSLRYNWRGYTYVDEMRGAAVLQLTYVGLRFNEAKSQNPFAYYTAAVDNSFKRVLNTEKRVQTIRDDVLEMNGLNPSFTRQHSNDLGKEKKRIEGE